MCTCSPDYTCESHRTPEENARMDRQASAHGHAFVDVQEAQRILLQGAPRSFSEQQKLAKAAESLNAYLAELEG
jgi:hypothetical protein